MNYYYAIDNNPLGPVPLEQLHELYRGGTIKAETLVVPEGGDRVEALQHVMPRRRSRPLVAIA
jgi:hypothetical protein